MSRPKDPLLFVKHIYDAIHDVQKYSHEIGTFEKFVNDSKTQDAIIRKLEIIGEAANNLDPNFLSQYPEVNWKGPIKLRNILAHQYFELDLATIWDILDKDLSPLESQIKMLLEKDK